MNDRIKELIDECWVTREHCTTWFDHEKFAELIVRECVDCLKPLSRDHSMVGAAQDTIKDHFGVEETKGWVCPKCGTDRTKAVCPKGHHASMTGDCPMVGVAQ